MKDLSRNLGNILTVGTLKAFFSFCLPPFSLCWSHRSGIAPGSLTDWHLPLCLRHEGSGGGKRPGKFKKSVPFLQPSAKLAFLGNWALMPGVREKQHAARMPGQVQGCGRTQALGEAGTTDLLTPTVP